MISFVRVARRRVDSSQHVDQGHYRILVVILVVAVVRNIDGTIGRTFMSAFQILVLEVEQVVNPACGQPLRLVGP
ncbi:hypothetical protein ABQF26_18765, partial [Mycolicibacterium elephantis]